MLPYIQCFRAHMPLATHPLSHPLHPGLLKEVMSTGKRRGLCWNLEEGRLEGRAAQNGPESWCGGLGNSCGLGEEIVGGIPIILGSWGCEVRWGGGWERHCGSLRARRGPGWEGAGACSCPTGPFPLWSL